MSQLDTLLQQCTVKLTLPGRTGWGTGFFVAPEWILTCAHVVREAQGQPVQIRWQQRDLEAVVERTLPDPYDLALLRVTLPTDANPPCVYLDEVVQSRDPLYLFGYPDEGDRQGEPRTFNCDGMTGSEIASILFNLGQVRPGMSGSPLLNQRTGKVCGIVKFTRDRSFDLGGGAIPARVILEQFPQLRELQQEFHGQNPQWLRLVTETIASSSPNPSKPPETDFQPYLRAIANHYAQQRDLYTPTDALLPLEARSVERQEGEDRQEKKVEQFPVLAGLRQYALGERREHVLLAGRPGSGKSTALRQLALGLAEEARQNPDLPIPVLVQLKADRSVPELIQAEFRRVKQRVTVEQIDDWLLDDRLILLLDGVNEVPTDKRRQALALFREDNLSVPVVFTTRDLAVGGDLGIGKRLEMKPLSPEQMKVFVGKYLPEHGEQLLGQLRDRLRELAETPLLLKMLCDVFDPETNQIPQNRGELFQWFDRDYKRIKREIEYVPVSENFWEYKSEILQYLAFSMIQGEVQTADLQKPPEAWLTITKSRAEAILETWLHQRGVLDAPTKAKLWLKDLCNHHFLQDAAKPEEIEFHHQLFQEYYVAEYLLQQLPDLLGDENRFKQDYLNHLKWTEPIALMLGLLNSEPQVLKIVQQALDVDWMLGARLAGEVKPKFQVQTVKFVEDLAVPDWLKVQLLGETRSSVATPLLLQALSNPNINIVQQAASFIGKTTNQTAIDLLTQRLEKMDSTFFAQAQTFFGGPDPTGRLWTKHIEALAYLLPQAAIQFLRSKLIDKVNERDEGIIRAVTQAPQLLMQLDGESILPRLIEKLYDTQSENFEKQLHEQSKNQNNPFGWELTPRLIERIKESAIESQKTKILNLIDYANNYESIIPDLIKALEQEKITSIQTRIIQLIGQSNHELVNQTLVDLLSHEDFKIRKEAGIQLIKRKTEETSDIEKILEHENWDVAWSAAVVLGSLGSPAAFPILAEALQKREFGYLEVRCTTAKVLASMNAGTSIPLLLDILSSNLDEAAVFLRREAAFSLSQFGREEAIPELMCALQAGYSDGYRNGIKGLARLNVQEPLWKILSTKAPGWQTAAIELSKLGKTEVLPNLCEALADLGSESSNEVIHLLAKLSDLETCNWLVNALHNPEPHQVDQYFCNRIAFVLVECCPEIVKSCLPALKEIIARSYVRQIFWLIPAIQANCNFYNYETFQAYLTTQNADRKTHPNSDRPVTYKVNAEVVQIIENNHGTIHGKQTL